MTRFLRTDYWRHSRLGKKRKKLQKWRRARGKHSKIRRKRFGYPAKPEIGYGTRRNKAGKINNLIPKLIHNSRELESLNESNGIIIARVGAKKKLEIIKKAEDKNIKILNIKK